MGLFDKNYKTFAVKAFEEADRVYMTCSMSAQRSFDDFWYAISQGKKTLKSKEVLEQQLIELGTDAVEVMNQHSALQAFLYGLRPYNPFTKKGWIPLYPPYEYTPMPDGSIVLGDLKAV
jgi:hypothetical protein